MTTVIKLTYDQMKLFKRYKALVDPSFPTAANDANLLNAIKL